MTTTESTLEDYKEKRVYYLEFIDTFKSLAQVLICKDSKLGVVQITGHLKSLDELTDEISVLPDGSYPILSDMQNLMTLRIVTFYKQDIDPVLKRLMESFEVTASAVTSPADDPETFGYPGSALVLKLADDRLRFEEYKRFADMQIEVQVYSLFQDTWSKIERYIGYNSEQFPTEHLREFTHLAYMMELCDSELNNIRSTLTPFDWSQHKKPAPVQEAKKAVDKPAIKSPNKNQGTGKIELAMRPEPVAEPEAKTPIATASPADLLALEKLAKTRLNAPEEDITIENIDNFILSNNLVRKFDKLISETYNTRLMYRGKNIEPLFASIDEVNIYKTLADLERQLHKKRQSILSLAIEIFGPPEKQDHEHIPKGITLFLLSYHTIAATRNIKLVQEFLDKYSFDKKLINKNSVLW